jgi:hypothetical protein
MCGILGFVGRDGQPLDRESFIRARDTMTHRGPDDAGIYEDGPVMLGHRRLSIIDLGGGHQPMSAAGEAVWIVFNGEIYNFRELRDELAGKGHAFRTASDTEVILHLYLEEGVRGFERLNGIFAFAIWDRRSGELHLVRDQLGIKPLYYADTPRGLVFASEVKTLLATGLLKPVLEAGAIPEYLVFRDVSGERTMFRGVRRLLPGHRLTMCGGRIETHRYWDLLSGAQPTFDGSFEEAVDALESLLDDAVRMQMISDVPSRHLLQRWRGFEPGHRAGGSARLGTDQYFLRGLRRGGLRRERLCPPGGGALRHPPSRDPHFQPRVRRQPREAHLAQRRAAALPELGAHPCCQRAGAPARDRGADRGGRRRAVRRLSALPDSRAAGALAARTRPGALAGPLARPGTGRSPGAEARPLPRHAGRLGHPDELGVLGRGALGDPRPGRAAGRFRLASRRLRGDRGTAGSGHPSVPARPADLPGLDPQPPGQDEHGDQHRVPGAFPGSARGPFRPCPADGLQAGRLDNKRVVKGLAMRHLPVEVIKRRKSGFGVPLADWFRADEGLGGLLAAARDDALVGEVFGEGALQVLQDEHRSGRADHSDALWAALNLALWRKAFGIEASSLQAAA